MVAQDDWDSERVKDEVAQRLQGSRGRFSEFLQALVSDLNFILGTKGIH